MHLKSYFFFVLFLIYVIFFPSKIFSIWIDGTPLPIAKSGTSAAIINNEIAVIGGKGIIGNNPLSEIFDIEGNNALCVQTEEVYTISGFQTKQNIQWIVDYKTPFLPIKDLSGEAKKHRSQLNLYENIFKDDDLMIQKAIYFAPQGRLIKL